MSFFRAVIHLLIRSKVYLYIAHQFYRYLNDVGEYLEGMAEVKPLTEVKTVADLLNEIEN